jgi:hypothetical protein
MLLNNKGAALQHGMLRVIVPQIMRMYESLASFSI